jgi:hypothetical protein
MIAAVSLEACPEAMRPSVTLVTSQDRSRSGSRSGEFLDGLHQPATPNATMAGDEGPLSIGPAGTTVSELPAGPGVT